VAGQVGECIVTAVYFLRLRAAALALRRPPVFRDFRKNGAHSRCEWIGEKLSSAYSPPLRGGEGCGVNKSREATEEAAGGVVSSAKCLGLNNFAELTTPAAPISEGIHFIDGASTPPLRGWEYLAFLSIANSFTP